MKKLAFLFIFTLTVALAFAQFDPGSKTSRSIFSKNNTGGYGAITTGYSKISEKGALVVGARGGINFNQKLAVGIGAYGFANNLHIKTFTDHQPLEKMLIGAYGGLFVEPVVKNTKKMQLSAPVLFGMGAAVLIEDHGIENSSQMNKIDNDLYYVLEPGIEMTFNLGPYFRPGAAIHYRRAISFDMTDTNDNALNGLTFGLIFKFGKS